MSSDGISTNSPVVVVEGLAKRYPQARVGPGEASLRDLLSTALSRPWRLVPGLRADAPRPAIEALQPISFTVPPGQALGLIGPNGSGKSTLLKILARITLPSLGTARIHGRLAAILEVGTGFHPDLTGLENIHLGGAILGLRRRDIAAALDDIIAFAAIGDLLDVPVKRYSSGQYVRLAFSVAAHLCADVLLIDEVLAVGDEGFRHRCLDRMRDHVERGGSLIVVSHDMTAVRQVCDRCLVLDQGRLVCDADVDEAVACYQQVLGVRPGLTNTSPG